MDIVECSFNFLSSGKMSPSDAHEWISVVDVVCARGHPAETMLALQTVAERGEYTKRHLLFDKMRICLSRVVDRIERRLALMSDLATTIRDCLQRGRVEISNEDISSVVKVVGEFQRKLDSKFTGDLLERQRTISMNFLAEISAVLLSSYMKTQRLGPLKPVRPLRVSLSPSYHSNDFDPNLRPMKLLGDASRLIIPGDEDFVSYAQQIIQAAAANKDDKVDRSRGRVYGALLLCREMFQAKPDKADSSDKSKKKSASNEVNVHHQINYMEDVLSNATTVNMTSMLERCIVLIEELICDFDKIQDPMDTKLLTGNDGPMLAHIFLMLMLNRCKSQSIHTLCFHFVS